MRRLPCTSATSRAMMDNALGREAGLPHPGHLMPNMQGDAADAVDGVLRAAINKRSKTLGSKAVANGQFGSRCIANR
jgi:hypothetical protein